MTQAEPFPSQQTALKRGGQQLVDWLRELEECRIGGLVSDEDYAYQRAEKLTALLRPTHCLWLASITGAAILSAIAWALTWQFTGDWRAAAGIACLAGVWGLTSLGRALREKFTELQLHGRRRILVALLENDLLTATEFADYDDRLAEGRQDFI
jgi:hypothetical protein